MNCVENKIAKVENNVTNKLTDDEKFWIKVGIVMLIAFIPFFWALNDLDKKERTKKTPAPSPQGKQATTSLVPTTITITLNSDISGLTSTISLDQIERTQIGSSSTLELVSVIKIGRNSLYIYQDQNGNVIRRELVDPSGKVIPTPAPSQELKLPPITPSGVESPP